MAKRRKRTKKLSYSMKKKLVAAMILFVAVFCLLLFRIYYIIDKDKDRYTRRVLAQQSYVSNELLYRRGDIVDRNGTTMAISVKVYDAVISPFDILENEKNGNYTISKVAEFFGLDETAIREAVLARPESKYLKLEGAKNLTTDQVEAFKQLEEEVKNTRKEAESKEDVSEESLPPVIDFVWFEEKYERKYPLGTVACNVVGFTDNEQGSFGIESYYNSVLSGSNGREYGYYDSQLNLQRTVKPAVNGDTVISSIDSNAQRIIEEKIAKYKKDPGAENVAVMLMDPNNGEVLAMATDTLFDLNNPRDLSAYYTEKEEKAMSEEEKVQAYNNIWKNFCISDTYEPGSTFKSFTVAAAMDEGTINVNSSYNCSGKMQVSNYEIGCANRVAHGVVTPKTALMQSCNVALMNIAAGLGRTQFHRYVDLYGFGKTTGIDLYGEERGIIHTEENLNTVELATSSFGQTQNVTMIQMLSAFCSLINGGNYYQPHVVKEIVNEQGGVVENIEGRVLRKTITPETSSFIREALLDTVVAGTAKDAAVAGYEIGGKTGTAEKRPLADKNYIVSFIGFAPADNPQVAIYVLIDQPHVEDQAHSTYATKFASEIMKEVFPFLGLYPEGQIAPDIEEASADDSQE